MKKFFLLLMVLSLIFSVQLFSQIEGYSVKGKITPIKKSGDIHISLFDKNITRDFKGIQELIIEIEENEIEKNEINFEFKDVEKGKYAIRCYQDINDNNKIDIG